MREGDVDNEHRESTLWNGGSVRWKISMAIVVVVVSVLSTSPQASATSSLLVAVTTNFIEPFREIAALFEARTRIPGYGVQGKT